MELISFLTSKKSSVEVGEMVEVTACSQGKAWRKLASRGAGGGGGAAVSHCAPCEVQSTAMLMQLPFSRPWEPSAGNCLTLHISNESRARRAAKEAKEAPAQPAPEKVKVEVKKFVKIGRPGYKGLSAGPVAGDALWLLELA